MELLKPHHIDLHFKTLVVIGGGAAGFFCAVNAARIHPDLRVIIIEKSSKVLSKVKVSGGGRCNVTHACESVAQLIKNYPRGASFLKKAFHHFTATDTVRWFESRGVQLKTEPDGRIFPVTNQSETIIRCLLDEAEKYNVELKLNTAATMIKIVPGREETFELQLSSGEYLRSNFLCVATGGITKNATAEWLVSLGHELVPPAPSLFTFNIPGNAITSLMGITCSDAMIKIAGDKLSHRGSVLITHWGLSGPAVLKASAWAARLLQEKKYECSIMINWLPAFNENTLREKLQKTRFELAAQKIANRNPFGLPARLWEFLLSLSGIPVEMRWADLPATSQNQLAKTICSHVLAVKGKTTFKEEFVTAGGISLSQVDVNTMQSKLINGLFFAGEVLDIDGITGGFNFQNAWTTGWIAAAALNS